MSATTDIVGVNVSPEFLASMSLQGCKWHKPEGCPGPRLRCPFCLVLPCLTILQKISNHLEMVKGNCTTHCMSDYVVAVCYCNSAIKGIDA